MPHGSQHHPADHPDDGDHPLLQRRLGRRLFLGGMSSAALASLSLAACGPTASGPQQPAAGTTTGKAPAAQPPAAGQNATTLNVICASDYQPLVESFGQQFKQQTGTSVNVTAQAYNQTHDKIVSALAGGGAGADIVGVDSVWDAEFAAAKFITPLDSYVPKSTIDQIVPAALVSRSYQGKLYQWPWFTLKSLYYNDKMLTGAGFDHPPATWDELTSMSRAIMKKGLAKYGLVWAGSAAEGLVCDYVLLMNAFGGKYQDDKGTWILNQGGGLKALEYIVSTIGKDGIADPASKTLDDRSNRNAFAAGDVAFILNWTSAWKQFTDPQSSKVSESARIGLVPGTTEANVVSSTCTGGSGFGITDNSRNKDAAWKFITFMAGTEDAQKRWLKENNQIPTLKTVYDDPQVIQANPQFGGPLRKQMDYGFGRPDVPWYGDWTKVMQLELNRAIVGDKSPKQALDDAMHQINQLQADNTQA